MKPPDRITLGSDGEGYIRDLPVAALDVYKDLAFFGLSGAAVLEKYVGLVVEDLAAVREYNAYVIKSRDHDPINGCKILPKSALKDKAYFFGRCRNATVARWCQSEGRFYHWREKFGNIYVETILYATDERHFWWDVFFPVHELPAPPFEIPFDANAEFHGNPDDLTKYDSLMWGKYGNKHGWDIDVLQSKIGDGGKR